MFFRHSASTRPLRLSGIITALATPFTATGALDRDAWRQLLQRQLDGGVQAVVVAGSTGEAAALDDAEYDRLLDEAVTFVNGRIPVLAGTGLSATARTVALTRRAAAQGADAALVVVPPYVRPTQAGMLAHYTEVAENGDLPVVLYNVPARTGSDLLPDTVARLAAHPRIVGIKEACADPERMADLLSFKSDAFAVLSGDDATGGRAMLAGADGLASVGSNVLPQAFRALCEAARAGNRGAAEAWQARLRPFIEFLGLEPNPIPVKALLQREGIGKGLRLPLLPLSQAHHALADELAVAARTLELQSAREPRAA